MKHTNVFLGFLVFIPTLAFGGPTAFIEGNALLVSNNGELKRYVLPPQLASSQAMEITISKQNATPLTNNGGGGGAGGGNGNGPNENPTTNKLTPAPPLDVNSLIVRANKLFHRKKYNDALKLLDAADASAPENDRVKTMKGSLYYALGYKELAKSSWESSLKLNPNQPAVKQYVESMGRERPATPSVDTKPE